MPMLPLPQLSSQPRSRLQAHGRLLTQAHSRLPTQATGAQPSAAIGFTWLAGLVLAWLAIAAPQAKAEVPSRTPLQVVNVASDDVLNLRQAPNARSAIVGEMPPGSREVITVGPSQGDWLYVRHDWSEGWARARYLMAIGPGVGLKTSAQQPLHGLVIGVRSGQSLALRYDPNESAGIVAHLRAGSKDARLTGLTQDGWRQVEVAGRLGWAPQRNLIPVTADDDHGQEWQCGGTEPFWGLRLIADKLRYTNLDGNEINSLAGLTELPGLTDGEPGATKLLTSSGGRVSARIEAMSQRGGQACSDGMSDIDYPYYIRALIGAHNFEGCCTLNQF